jgi:hypothetical protein
MQLHQPAVSAILAEQHRDELCHQAKQTRLARAGRGVRGPRWDVRNGWRRLTMRTISA